MYAAPGGPHAPPGCAHAIWLPCGHAFGFHGTHATCAGRAHAATGRAVGRTELNAETWLSDPLLAPLPWFCAPPAAAAEEEEGGAGAGAAKMLASANDGSPAVGAMVVDEAAVGASASGMVTPPLASAVGDARRARFTIVSALGGRPRPRLMSSPVGLSVRPSAIMGSPLGRRGMPTCRGRGGDGDDDRAAPPAAFGDAFGEAPAP